MCTFCCFEGSAERKRTKLKKTLRLLANSERHSSLAKNPKKEEYLTPNSVTKATTSLTLVFKKITQLFFFKSRNQCPIQPYERQHFPVFPSIIAAPLKSKNILSLGEPVLRNSHDIRAREDNGEKSLLFHLLQCTEDSNSIHMFLSISVPWATLLFLLTDLHISLTDISRDWKVDAGTGRNINKHLHMHDWICTSILVLQNFI